MALTLANKITIARIIAVPIFIGVLASYTPERDFLWWVALGIYFLAEVTDVVDGYIARNFRQKTRAGSILDPLADKLLFVSALVCLYQVGVDNQMAVRLPLWLVIALASREVILLIGGSILEFTTGGFDLKPNIWGRATAFLQAVCVVAVFLQLDLALMIWWAALAVAFVSGVIYIREGIKVLNNGHT